MMTTRVSAPDPAAEKEAGGSNWTTALRGLVERRIPWSNLLPDRQPFFIGSWVYVFGVVAITSLVWVIGSGVVLAFFGPGWWHVNTVGRFVNSIHFWSVQMFFLFTVLHLWGQYFMASWRDGRATTWIVGVVIFLAGLVTGFTGYISQQDLDAQWIAVNAKDAVNAVGAGAFFNPLDFGQMYGIHVMLLPIAVTLLVVLHVIQVRMRGVVKPIELPAPAANDTPTAGAAS
jgi:quinol---cytochrome c reductase cytochrome b subunit, bacillus type